MPPSHALCHGPGVLGASGLQFSWIQEGEFPAAGPTMPTSSQHHGLGMDHTLPPPSWCSLSEAALPTHYRLSGLLPTPLYANADLEYFRWDLTQVPLPGSLNFHTTTERMKHIWAKLAE